MSPTNTFAEIDKEISGVFEWESQPVAIDWGKFSGLKYLDCFKSIEAFLVDEDRVGQALLEFVGSHAFESEQGLHNALSVVEKKHGFTGDVKRLKSEKAAAKKTKNEYIKSDPPRMAKGGLVGDQDFYWYIQAKRPLYDMGVGDGHGAFTHRIQWALVSLSVTPPNGKSMGDVYAETASAAAWVGREFPERVWDYLVDYFDCTGRSPEFFCPYMSQHSDSRVRIMGDSSKALDPDVKWAKQQSARPKRDVNWKPA